LGREKKVLWGSVRLGKRRKRVFKASLSLGKGEKDPRGLLYVWEK